MKSKLPKVYVITTGHEDRIARIKKYLDEYEIAFVHSLPFEELKELEKTYQKVSHQFRQKAIMAGEIGCFHTHSQAWELIVAEGQPAIIIEDNIQFTKEPSKLFEQSMVDMIEDCGVVAFYDFPIQATPGVPFSISSIPEKKPFPTVCYGVTPARAANMLASMKKSAYVVPIDRWMSIPKLCGVYCYISPVRFCVRASKSEVKSIANKYKGKKTLNPINVLHWIYNKSKYKF